MRRLLWLVPLLAAALVEARPRTKMIEVRRVPASPRAMAKLLEKEKPGPFRDKVLAALEAKLREHGEELTDPDALDALAREMLKRVFADMAAPTEVWTWEGHEAPRGDVLIRGTVKLFPGRTTSGFDEKFTVSPKGKRIDRGYLDTPCTVEVKVARGVPDWRAWVASQGWGAYLHPVRASEDVAWVALSLLSPGSRSAPGPWHERPVWVGLFRRGKPGAAWEPVDFQPATAPLQALQDTNFIPVDPKAKEPPRLTDEQRRLVLALRMEDVRLLDPAQPTFSAREARWFSLKGLNEAPVDEKTAAWLDPYRTSPEPLVRAAAVLEAHALGAPVEPAELLDVLKAVKVRPVVEQAAAALTQLLDASREPVGEADRAALLQLAGGAGEVKVLKGVARVQAQGRALLFKKGAGGWEPAPGR